MTDNRYREEREARWRNSLVNHASVLEMCAIRLRAAADEPDCNQAKRIADEAAGLAKTAADLVLQQSVEHPPKRSDI
jgi:hypothetical protein